MIDVIRDAERKSSNIVSLSELLEGAQPPFRRAILDALKKEGFEMDEPLPCLQHPMEIAEALQCLAYQGFGTDWNAFQQALFAASRTGILVDMSRTSQVSKRPGRGKPSLRHHPHRHRAALDPLIRVEFRNPGAGGPWSWFGATTRPDWAQELLEVCRQAHPGSECRIQGEDAVPQDRATREHPC